MNNDIIGKRIGIYDVLYECEEKSNDGHKLYHVKCSECGWETDMMKAHIGRAKKCRHVGLGGIYTQTHTDIYWNNKRLQSIYKHMKQRCYSNECKDYRWYGFTGIKICDEWLNDPKSFEVWALSNGYNDELTIDRKDESKNYCPENCRWISMENNSKYKSTTSLITANHETHTGKDWSKILGLGINKINEYVRKYGLDNTICFIEKYIQNPGLKPKTGQSYYDLYMTIQN